MTLKTIVRIVAEASTVNIHHAILILRMMASIQSREHHATANVARGVGMVEKYPWENKDV